MSLSRRNPKRDTIEKDCIAALRAVGAEVWPLSGKGIGDLLIRYRGVLTCLELKSGKAGKLTPHQGAFPVARCAEECLIEIGALEMTDFLRPRRR